MRHGPRPAPPPARRSSASGLGTTPTTSVRRLISLLSRSIGLVDQTFFQWLTGNEVKASSFSALLRNMISSLGNWRPSMSGDHVQLLAHMVGVRLGEDRADGGR